MNAQTSELLEALEDSLSNGDTPAPSALERLTSLVRRELVQTIAEQMWADLKAGRPDDQIDERMMTAGVRALTRGERTMGEVSRRLYLHAAAVLAMVMITRGSDMPTEGTA